MADAVKKNESLIFSFSPRTRCQCPDDPCNAGQQCVVMIKVSLLAHFVTQLRTGREVQQNHSPTNNPRVLMWSQSASITPSMLAALHHLVRMGVSLIV